MSARIITEDGTVYDGATLDIIVEREWGQGARLHKGRGERGTWSVVVDDHVVEQPAAVWPEVPASESALVAAQQQVDDLEGVLADARAARDQIVRDMVEQGVTMYAVAKVSGLTQPAVAKILARG